MPRPKLVVLGSISAVTALIATLASPAYAEEEVTGYAEEVAATVQAAAPEGTLSDVGVMDGDQLVTSIGGIKSMVPLSSEEDIVVTASGENGTQFASIELPDEIEVGDGVVAHDGTVVFAADDNSGDAIAVQTLADGSTRIQTVIGSASSAHEFSYRMDGYQPYQADTGEVIFMDDVGNYVPVASPWAIDADGNPVQTSYEVRGDKLFQIVTPNTSTTYPVVADPSWTWYGVVWGMKLTRTETARVRNYAAALGMCATFTSKLPKIAIACGVLGSYIVAQANIAQGDKPKTCLFLAAVPPGVIFRITC